MLIPNKFRLALRNGVEVRNDVIIDHRTSVVLQLHDFTKEEACFLNDWLKRRDQLFDLSEANKDEIKQWKKCLSTLDELHLFVFQPEPSWLRFFLNNVVLYKKSKIAMVVTLFFIFILYSLILYTSLNLLDNEWMHYILKWFYFLVTSFLIHEVTHAFVQWMLDPNSGNGYFVVNKHHFMYISKKGNNEVVTFWIALLGPVVGVLFGCSLLFEQGWDFGVILIILVHLIQLIPCFPDGKIVWRA